MAPLFVLVITLLVLRGIGLLGVRRLSSWREAGLLAVAIMFLFTGVTHFTDMKYDYAAMLPDFAPMKVSIIYLTGALQILGAIGLLIPRTRRLAGICLALLLVAMFPGNVYAAINEIPFRGEPPTPLWLRAPIQLFFIGMTLWTSVAGSVPARLCSRRRSGRPPSTSSPPGKAHRRDPRSLAGRRIMQSRLPASAGPATVRCG